MTLKLVICFLLMARPGAINIVKTVGLVGRDDIISESLPGVFLQVCFRVFSCRYVSGCSCRWSSEIKKDIKESRIKVTSKVVELINSLEADNKPSVLVSATAVGYYGTSETRVFDEKSPSGNDYLAEVLEGQKVLPSRAKELGFSFKYPYIKDALKAVLSSQKHMNYL